MTTRRLIRPIIQSAAVIIIVVAALSVLKNQLGRSAKPMNTATLQGETPLPELEIKEFGKDHVRLAGFKAKVILINFWATWCEACMVEMPSIVKLWKTYKDRGFDVIAMNVDENPDASVPGAIKKFGIEFPVYTDQSSRLAEILGVNAIPFTAIIDSNRKVLYVENGERDWFGSDVRAQLEKWLAR